MPDLFFYRDPDEVEEVDEFASALEARQAGGFTGGSGGGYEEKPHLGTEVREDWEADHEVPPHEWALETNDPVITEVAPASWNL